MGTLRVQGALPWSVRWARHAGTRDFCPALTALVSQVQNIIFLVADFFQPGHVETVFLLIHCSTYYRVFFFIILLQITTNFEF